MWGELHMCGNDPRTWGELHMCGNDPRTWGELHMCGNDPKMWGELHMCGNDPRTWGELHTCGNDPDTPNSTLHALCVLNGDRYVHKKCRPAKWMHLALKLLTLNTCILP